jgi:predicted N-acetyltransferase YhbS
VGARLLDTAVAFARAAGYDGIHLATCADLHGARRQYERAGFTLAWEDDAPCRWAPWTREQVWEMRLLHR